MNLNEFSASLSYNKNTQQIIDQLWKDSKKDEDKFETALEKRFLGVERKSWEHWNEKDKMSEWDDKMIRKGYATFDDPCAIENNSIGLIAIPKKSLK